MEVTEIRLTEPEEDETRLRLVADTGTASFKLSVAVRCLSLNLHCLSLNLHCSRYTAFP